jgi:RNA recognition motif-containing protein
MKKIFVANLPYQITEEELKIYFEVHGTVESVKVIKDRNSGRSKGFGFIEMDDDGAEKAVENLDQKELGGRNLKVEISKS